MNLAHGIIFKATVLLAIQSVAIQLIADQLGVAWKWVKFGSGEETKYQFENFCQEKWFRSCWMVCAFFRRCWSISNPNYIPEHLQNLPFGPHLEMWKGTCVSALSAQIQKGINSYTLALSLMTPFCLSTDDKSLIFQSDKRIFMLLSLGCDGLNA